MVSQSAHTLDASPSSRPSIRKDKERWNGDVVVKGANTARGHVRYYSIIGALWVRVAGALLLDATV